MSLEVPPIKRRTFALSALGTVLAPAVAKGQNASKNMTSDIPDITPAERQARREKAKRLMKENGIGAIFLEPGPSLFYFTGIRWGRSERMFGMLFPAAGEPVYVVPAFEEQRSRELIPPHSEIRIWQEDESPAARVLQAVRDRKISGHIGI